jgi:hypothetical protein
MRAVKFRAVEEGRKLKDILADLIQKGLSAPLPSSSQAPLLRDPRSGLLVVACKRPASPPLTPRRFAEILIEQEAGWQNEAGR